MQIEIEYNLSEVDRFLEHLNWLKSRIQAGQIAEDELFLPMQKFDYSSIAPLANSGYFHILLGPENGRKYLEFNHFFRIDNGQNLMSMLRTEHSAGKSMDYLDWVGR